MRVVTIGSVIALSIGLAIAGEPSTGKTELSRAQATAIVLTFLKSQGYDIHSPLFDLQITPTDPDFPDFYMFHAFYDTTTRLASVGTYAVNRKTAVLWERIGCEQLKSKALEELQNRLRKEMGLSGGEGSSSEPCL
jgi:hypothetical protein